MHKLPILVTLILCLSACSGVQVSDYSDRQPVFDVAQFFNGPLTAHGVVKNRGGKVIRSFDATIDAHWQEGTGILDEDFVFDDGEQQKRVWKLQRQSDGTYLATAGDVTGTGLLQQSGNSVFLDYVLQIPYQGSTIEVRVDDRMYLLTPNLLINESKLFKFGVRVGELLLVIQRSAD